MRVIGLLLAGLFDAELIRVANSYFEGMEAGGSAAPRRMAVFFDGSEKANMPGLRIGEIQLIASERDSGPTCRRPASMLARSRCSGRSAPAAVSTGRPLRAPRDID